MADNKKVIARGGESYDDAHWRVANSLGHSMGSTFISMCIRDYFCKKCGKHGWNNLMESCKG